MNTLPMGKTPTACVSRAAVVFLCLLIALIPAAVTSADGQGAAGQKGVVFASEHIRLTAYFLDGAVRLVFSDGQERILPQAVSASGARYTDGMATFWNKGDEAYVTWNGQEYTVRVVNPETDPWEMARREGVTLRAIGQEPGWLLEIRDHRYAHLLLDYGDTKILTPVAEMAVDFTRRITTYRTMPPTSPLRMVITAVSKACYDVMSGEGFTLSVEVNLNDGDRVYRGCGRWLNQP